MSNLETLKQKRQYFHQLLLALGEERYKEVIVEAHFGVSSTRDLNEEQLNILIDDARKRLGNNQNAGADLQSVPSQKQLRMWRNKCLLVLNERGIKATPKDWTAVNEELSKKQYQWILKPALVANGKVNRKGLYAFRTADDLKKLFKQLCSICDNEQAKAKELKDLALKN